MVAALTSPAGHDAPAWLSTFSLSPQVVASYVLTDIEASWLPVLVLSAGHAAYSWFTTFSLARHCVAVAVALHVLPEPDALLLAAFAIPANHAVHAGRTFWSSAHVVALHVVPAADAYCWQHFLCHKVMLYTKCS